MANSSELGAGDVKLLKDQYNGLRDDVLDPVTGHTHTGEEGGGKLLDLFDQAVRDYVCVRDKKNQNTNGGTFTLGAWRKRDITEELVDTGSICSIATNQITLAAGTYRCLISAPAYRVAAHQARLWDTSNGGALLVLGTTEVAGDAAYSITRSWISGRFTLAAESVLEVQHYCTATLADEGFGIKANITDEIYTVAEFWREVA